MSDVKEARQYGVKTFPSIIVFVKRIPELYEGDVTDEAKVLGWALVQAGIVEEEEDDTTESMVEEVMEDIDEMLTFPGASAESKAPPTPKVEPKQKPSRASPSPATPSPPSPSSPSSPTSHGANKSESSDAEQDELSEIVDSIKNDNNVVVFFCKYYEYGIRSLLLYKSVEAHINYLVKILTKAVSQSNLVTVQSNI